MDYQAKEIYVHVTEYKKGTCSIITNNSINCMAIQIKQTLGRQKIVASGQTKKKDEDVNTGDFQDSETAQKDTLKCIYAICICSNPYNGHH